MTGRIYLLKDNSDLMAMEEAPYDSEKLLQEMLAQYPDLLAGEQINSDEPRRWLLVTREMPVQGDEDDSPRWSLDHLFLDQDAVPTLVEVKKGSSTDIRRKVIGQMLDKINEIPGVNFGEEVLTKRARIRFEKLTNGESMAKLKSALAWLIERVTTECEREA